MPEFLDDVRFFDAGAAGVAVSNVNNYVDANFGGNIASLQYGNTNGNHTTAARTWDHTDNFRRRRAARGH